MIRKLAIFTQFSKNIPLLRIAFLGSRFFIDMKRLVMLAQFPSKNIIQNLNLLSLIIHEYQTSLIYFNWNELISSVISDNLFELTSFFEIFQKKFYHVKQNVPSWDAHSTKNFCLKSNTFQNISFQSFQIGSGTPCRTGTSW